jgi:NosR/NirI family transcriptional regulator, nitrous oxide reductase regulator
MQAALVSHPAIAAALLGEGEAPTWPPGWQPGEHAIASIGRGLYSFKGSGYVRGGIFDRIVLIQDDVSVRFRDRGHRRLVALGAAGAPEFTEADLFKIPADVGLRPDQAVPPAASGAPRGRADREGLHHLRPGLPAAAEIPARRRRAPCRRVPRPWPRSTAQDETAAHQALWKRIWADKQVEIAVTARCWPC